MLPSYKMSVVTKAREILSEHPLFLDTETTGLHNSAEIVEVCVIDEDGRVLFESLIRPRRSIPADAIWIHGITNEMVLDAPDWFQVWPQLEGILKDRIVGIYNAEFDLRMMQQSHQLHGLPWKLPSVRFFCIMKMYADFSGTMKWLKLEDAGRRSGIPLPNSHRARDDTLLAKELFQFIAAGGGSVKRSYELPSLG